MLLLARPHAGFWEDASAELERVWVDLADPLALEDFVTGPGDLAEAFNQATAAFQRELQIQERAVAQPAGLHAGREVSPLTVHMAALAAVCATDEGTPIPRSEDLSAYLLRHERRYWQRSSAGPEAMARAVLVATLFGPVSPLDRARAWLKRARLADGDADAERLLTAYERLYPSADTPPPDSGERTGHGRQAEAVSALAPLKPDRFAEDFLADQLVHEHTRASVTELITDEQTTTQAARQALLILAAAGSRHPTARSALFSVLRGTPIRPGWLSPPLVTTVLNHAPYDLADTVEAAIPIHHTDLLRLARDLAQRLHRQQPPDAPPAQRARRLNNLGIRLAGVGDRRAALGPVREAMGIWRRLAEAEPAAYLPYLAGSLNNFGIRLAEVGDKRAALGSVREAMGIYRRLAEAEPAAYLPYLAGSLNNLGTCLAEVGDKRAALGPARESVEIRRKLAEAEPAVYLPDLAQSLWVTACIRSAHGIELTEAAAAVEEAIAIYRTLAEQIPKAFNRYLAAAEQTKTEILDQLDSAS